jgi:hypothetical protein
MVIANSGSADLDDVEYTAIAGFRRIPLRRWRIGGACRAGATEDGVVHRAARRGATRAETGELAISACDQERNK